MAREPERRYQTAGEMAEDLNRFLEDRPIQARRVRLRERMWRWCRRNPAAAALTAGIAFLLVAGAAASTAAAVHAGRLQQQERAAREEAVREQQQAELDLAEAKKKRATAEDDRTSAAVLRAKAEADQADAEQSRRATTEAARQAESHSQKARAVVDDFVARVSDSHALRGPEMRRLRRVLLASALPFYQQFIAQHTADPEARASLAGADFRCGEIQRGTGNTAEARKEYQAALASYRALADADVRDTDVRIGLARCQAGLGAHQDAVRAWENLLKTDDKNGAYQAELARSLTAQAEQLGTSNRKVEALPLYERAVGLWTALVEEDPDNAATRIDLARTMSGFSRLLAEEGRAAEAVRQLTAGVRHAEIAADGNPLLLEYGRFLAFAYGQLADLQRTSDPEEALSWCDKAVQRWRTLADANPTLATLHAGLHDSYLRLAACRRDRDQDKEADEAVRTAAAVLDRLPRQTAEEQFLTGCVLALVARAADKNDAGPAGVKALDALRKAVAAGYRDLDRLREDEDLDVLRPRPEFRDLVAAAEKAEKERLAARTPAVIEAERRKVLLANREDEALGRYAIGLARIGVGKHDAAAASLAKSAELREALLRDDAGNARRHRVELCKTLAALGQLHWNAGRLTEGAQAWQRAVDLFEKATGEGPPDQQLLTKLAGAAHQLANRYWELGLWDDAADFYGKAFALLPPIAVQDWLRQALLLMYRGDLAAYRRHCEQMRRRFPQDNFHVVRAGTSGPGAIADLDDLVRRAKLDLAKSPKGLSQIMNMSMALLRSGRLEEARQIFRQGRVSDNFWAVHFALLYHTAGQSDEARTWLKRGDLVDENAWLDALAEKVVKLPAGSSLNNLVRFEIIRREAHVRLDGKPPENPWHRLHAARVYFMLGQVDKAEAALKAAAAARPDDVGVLLARARLLTQQGLNDRSEADFAAAQKLQSSDPLPWIRHGRFLAESGQPEQADTAFARAATLTAGEANRFLETGWWVVGTYPEEPTTAFPPEFDSDPSRPAGAFGKAANIPWTYAPVQPDGRVDVSPSLHAAVYALAYVASPAERTATIRIGASGPARLWLNGRLVYESTVARPMEAAAEQVPVVLRAGRNTLLVKVASPGAPRFFRLRFDDRPLDRAFHRADLGLWSDAVGEFRCWLERVGPAEVEDPQVWRAYPLLLLAAGDTEGYRGQCAHLLERYGENPDATPRWALAYDLALSPGTVADTAFLVQLAEESRKLNGRDPSRALVLLLARYRAGEHESALKVLDEAPEFKDWAPAWPALAMVHHRLGRAGEARQWLKKADEWYEGETRTLLDKPEIRLPLGSWWDLAAFQVLQREARTLIDGAAPKQTAAEKALQDRARTRLKEDPLTAEFDHALLSQPNEPRLWLARSRRLAELKRDAEPDFARAIELKPKDAETWMARGRIRAELGQLDLAAADLDTALGLAANGTPIADEVARWDEVFERVAARRPRDKQLFDRRVQFCVARGRWPEAAGAMKRIVELAPADAWTLFIAAPLLLEGGYVAEYRKVCRDMMTRFSRTGEDTLADRTAKTCLLLPDAVEDAAPVWQLAERATVIGAKSQYYPWFQFTRGLADYRAKQYSSCLAVLKSIPQDGKEPSREAAVHLVTAMAHHRLSQVGDARQALQRARSVMDLNMPHCDRGQMFDHQWQNWLRCQILLREAAALIEEKPEKKRAVGEVGGDRRQEMRSSEYDVVAGLVLQ